MNIYEDALNTKDELSYKSLVLEYLCKLYLYIIKMGYLILYVL